MTDIIRSDAATLAAKIAIKEVSSAEITRACLDQIEATDETYHAFLHVAADEALAAAAAIDKQVAAGEPLPSALAGVPLALKDVFTTSDMPTTCGSKILEGWRSPYDATLTARLRAAGIPILGKTNMDEFAMGSSTENSAYGPTRNPWNLDRVPGGSGGGSAAALAAFQAPLAIGSDTGGSIRQPAALTATVGVKPTYGTVSRYGLVACASSLDQGGPCARTVLDTALLHQVIAGHDPRDSTSVDAEVPDVVGAARAGAVGDLRGVRVGVVRQLHGGEGYQPGVLASFEAAVEQLTALGAEVSEVDCPHFDHALAAYYLILPSEVSSNLARFDAMRYGLRVGDDGTRSAEEVMAMTRAAGFGPEVKRRIMIGTYALSAGYYDAYYNQAQKVRTLIARDLDAAYRSVDVLVSPTTPTTAFRLGEKVDDPLAMYLFDLCTLPLNLAGHCGMSVPSGLSPDDGLPVGLQIMAPALADDRLYRVGAAYEAARGPLLRHLAASRHRLASGAPRPCDSVSARARSAAARQDEGMRIGVLTGGGDCPGLNAVIRAVVRTCHARYGSSVVGFQNGFRGLLENRRVQLHNDDRNDRLLAKGGTMLGTARVHPDKLRAGLPQIMQTLDDNGIDVLIPIGGEGTLTAASWLSEENVPVVGVPKTIDNDIDCTDVTFGHDTALTVATEAIDRLHSTAESHERVMLVEVMGRHAGWIALNAGLASGAHMTLIPEQPFDIEEVCRLVKGRFQRGDSHFICVVAEGAKPAPGTIMLREGGLDEFGHERFTGVAAQLAVEVEKRINKDVRVTVLGHIQRGGTPTAYDRVLATRFGVNAADAAHAGEYGQMVTLRGQDIGRVPLADAVRKLKLVPQSRYDDAAAFFG